MKLEDRRPYEVMASFLMAAIKNPEILVSARQLIEKGVEAESEYNERHNRALLDKLTNAKYFEVSEEIKKLLFLTDLPNINNELLQLPFPNVFIDVKFTKEEHGLDSDNIMGLLIFPVHIEKKDKEILWEADMFVVYNISVSKERIWLNQCNITTKSNIKVRHDRMLPNDYKVIRNFVFNFLLFLNDPQVEVRKIVRSQKNRDRRIKQGKFPLPSSNIIKLTGKLKLYLDKLNSMGGFSYSHRFWVRGHFRTLRHPRWKDKVGTRLWIPPFIKGEGILLEKEYKLARRLDEKNN